MNATETKHFLAIHVTYALTYGAHYLSHYKQMGEYWDGPLLDGVVFLNKDLLRDIPKKLVRQTLANMAGFDPHPVYTIDFFNGLMDSGCYNEKTTSYRRISFCRKPMIKEFLESEEHGQHIPLKKVEGETKDYYRTELLPFLSLPREGRKDRYLAGAIAGGDIWRDDNGILFCQIHKRCEQPLKELGVIYKRCGKCLLLSPFYVILLCGDLPFNVYRAWSAEVEKENHNSKNYHAVVAWMNWILTFDESKFKSKAIPYLMSRSGYLKGQKLTVTKVKKAMKQKRIDFLDKTIRQRIKRWYNIEVAINNGSL